MSGASKKASHLLNNQPPSYITYLQTFGNGSIAQAVLSQNRSVPEDHNIRAPALGTEMSINVGYGVGVMVGAYIAIGVTGAHMNPAVTLAMALRGKTCWLKVCIVHFTPDFHVKVTVGN